MNRFPPRPDVLTPVIMTRTAYAQLVGQKFYPPKPFGRWEERPETPEWRWKDIGMKIVRHLMITDLPQHVFIIRCSHADLR